MAEEQYFASEPSTPSRRSEITLELRDLRLTLVTDRGVFSGDRVDPGTRYLLLEAPPPPTTGAVLDLGCGYGPIAIACARRAPGTAVWALDVNQRALELCRENARANGCPNVTATVADGIPDDVRFTAIYSNPPVRVGKVVLHELLSTWLARLAPGGVAYLVVHKHLGADSLASWLRTTGYAVGRLGSRQGYRLLEVRAAD